MLIHFNGAGKFVMSNFSYTILMIQNRHIDKTIVLCNAKVGQNWWLMMDKNNHKNWFVMHCRNNNNHSHANHVKTENSKLVIVIVKTNLNLYWLRF